MRKQILSVALSTLALFLASFGASAETVSETLAKWGLIGVWKLDCSQPAGSGDAEAIHFEANGDGAVETMDFGAIKPQAPFVSAVINADGSLTIVTLLHGSEPFETTMIRDGDRRRVIQSRNVGSGVYGVRDGIYVAKYPVSRSGKPTPWSTRCP